MSFFCDAISVERCDSYFAAANTKNGFVSYFDDIFGKIKKIYVIKGGPGTGKSTLMNKIAAEGKNRGFEVQKYYCSSDTNSLDGVIVGGEFAVIDGTSPHATEPRNVGAVDEIINLCDMWDSEILFQKKEDICHLTKKISQKYTHVYQMLHAMATLESEYFSTVNGHVNQEKLKKFTDKIALRADRSADVKNLLCDAVGVHGYTHITSYENLAKKVIYLKGKYHEGAVLLKYLKASLDNIGAGYDISFSPESLEPSAIMAGDVAFVCVDTVPSDKKAFNAQRFLYPTIKNEKGKLRSIEQICKDLSILICNELASIGAMHDELEKYYKSAMNYDKLDRFTKKLLIKMFC